ncbi:unnamed protein product, partial [Sphagnum balticum]
FTRITNPKFAKGNVEGWLIEVERMMRETLRVVVQNAVADYSVTERGKWILCWPGMVVLCGSQMYWTSELEAAVRADGVQGLAGYEKKCTAQLKELVKLIFGICVKYIKKISGARGPKQYGAIDYGALVTIDVHARDVVTLLVELGIDNEQDFDWLSQLRYTLEDGQAILSHTHVLVKMVNACRKYGYEYLGNSNRLVITPLTDRCYRTLMGALHLNLGGAQKVLLGLEKLRPQKILPRLWQCNVWCLIALMGLIT